jgi:Tfp pilus assembly protein PilV
VNPIELPSAGFKPAPALARAAHVRLRLAGSESGFALIEVMVSAMLLAVVAIGVYSGIDGPTAVSGADRLRSQAAGIAQQDQDRLRSMRFDDLQTYSDPPRTVSLGNTQFTVTSRTRWIADSSGTDSCTNSSARADYLALTTTVSWAGVGSRGPVTMRSIQAPPTGTGTNLRGNLSVQIVNQTGTDPVPGLPISIDGPVRMNGTTNSEGCAVFPFVPVGDYRVSYQRSGWLDPTGAAAIAFNTSVTGNATTIESKQYAQAAAVNVTFEDSDRSTVKWTSGSITATGMPAPKVLKSAPAGTSVSSLTTGYTLYPFTSGYAGWGGGCPDPTQDPATAATVRLPTLRLVVAGGDSAVTTLNLVVTPAACADAATNPIVRRLTTARNVTVNVPVPYGDYDVCADDGTRRRQITAIQNRTPGGTTPQTLTIPTTGTKRVCP